MNLDFSVQAIETGSMLAVQRRPAGQIGGGPPPAALVTVPVGDAVAQADGGLIGQDQSTLSGILKDPSRATRE